jgi:hypothetical protein
MPSIGIQQKLYGREALITAAMTSTVTSSGNVPITIQDFKIGLQVWQIKIKTSWEMKKIVFWDVGGRMW